MSETSDVSEPPIPPMEDAAAVARIRRWNRFYKIAVIWLIGWVGLIVEKMVDLDHVERGLRSGLALGGVFSALLLLILTLPLAWLGSRIGSWEKWRRYRLWFTFALPTLFVLMGVVGSLKGRYFPQDRFRRMTGAEFPRDARVERVVFDDSIGALDEWACTYEFSCSAEETDRILREMELVEDLTSSLRTTSKGWLMTKGWHQIKEPGRGIYIQMETDASRTKVWIYCYTI